MTEAPKISICVITYQHADFIEKCLDSILSQKLSVPYEIILGEDGSTDGTREICRAYAERHKDKIKLQLRDRDSLASRSVLPGRYNFIETLKSAQGKYVALCDGDDYWSDPMKLQEQFDFLESNSDYILVGHNSMVNENGHEKPNPIKTIQGDFIDITTKDLIQRNPFINSMAMFRNIDFENLFDILNKFTVGDRSLFTFLSFKGKCRFYAKAVGFYRQHSSSTTSGSRDQYKKYKKDLINRLNHASYWNDYSGQKFDLEKNIEVNKRARQISNLAMRKFDFKTAVYYSQFIELKDLNKGSSKLTVWLLKIIYRLTQYLYSKNFGYRIVRIT
ncbi:MAG: glycosyltransferase [Flavobacteriaceae bacterium]|nr:glycosyltransferase [Flavobacteriaceae bacterium]